MKIEKVRRELKKQVRNTQSPQRYMRQKGQRKESNNRDWEVENAEVARTPKDKNHERQIEGDQGVFFVFCFVFDFISSLAVPPSNTFSCTLLE